MKMRTLLPQFLAWLSVFIITALIVMAVGEKPLAVLQVLWNSAFGSAENFSYTLFYATPMLLTGTAVSLALSAGLFNIGAEGQLYVGSLCAITWAYFTRNWVMGAALAVFGGALFAFAGGAAWGWLAGYLRVRRSTHEVIATIMLNFIAMAFANWVILNPLKNPENQSLETIWISEHQRIPHMWMQATYGLLLALLVSGFVLWFVRRSWWGFRVRATGANETAAKLAGIQTGHTAMMAMAISGGIAGLVGFHEIYMSSYRLIDSFSPGYGFTGLAIALLARGNFPKMIVATLMLAALHKGALDLDLETEKITRDLSSVIQALILVALAVSSAQSSRRKTA